MPGIKTTKPNHGQYFKISPLTKIFKQVKTLNSCNNTVIKLLLAFQNKLQTLGLKTLLSHPYRTILWLNSKLKYIFGTFSVYLSLEHFLGIYLWNIVWVFIFGTLAVCFSLENFLGIYIWNVGRVFIFGTLSGYLSLVVKHDFYNNNRVQNTKKR